jgi:Zn-dependent protease
VSLDPNDLIPIAIVLGIMFLIGFPVHEFSHALAAYRLGDGTAKMFGRLTLNPIAHFDPMGGGLLAISMILSGGQFGFGWAKPTPVNPMNLDGGRRGDAIVALAGPLSNLVLAAAGAIPLRYLVANPDLASEIPILVNVLILFVNINIVLMIFNLIPIPPLDGSHVLFAALDRETEWRIRPILQQYGLVIMFILILPILPGGSILGQVITPIIDAIFRVLVGV